MWNDVFHGSAMVQKVILTLFCFSSFLFFSLELVLCLLLILMMKLMEQKMPGLLFGEFSTILQKNLMCPKHLIP